MKLIAHIKLKNTPNPDSFAHQKYIIEKELNSDFVEVEVVDELVANE